MRKLLVLLVLAGALAANTFTVDGQTRAASARGGGKVLRLPGPDMNVRVQGSGSTVVLLHGFSASLGWWDRIAPELARNHRVIRLDLVGHGGSEAPESGYRMEDQARAVRRVLRRLRVRRAAVVGHSMGGVVATALAEREPKLVQRVAVIDTSPSTASGFDSDLGLAAKAYVTPVLGPLLHRVRTDSAVRSGVERAFAEDFDVDERFVDDVKRLTYPAFRDSRDAGEKFRTTMPLDERLARVHKPVLAIWGPRDRIAPVRGLERYRRVRGAKTVTIAGAGHTPNIERPRETLAALRSFLR